MLGYVKGYNICNITKRKANKDDFGVGIDSEISPEILRENVLEALEDSGKVYGLYKKKELVACYIFKKEKTASTEINQPAVVILTKDNLSKIVQGKINEISTENSNEMILDEEITVFKFSQKYVLPQHIDVMQQFEKAMLQELKECIIIGEVKAVVWGENILVTTQIKVGSLGSVSGIGLGALFGFIIFIIFDNFLISWMIGVIFAFAFGTIFKTTAKQSNKSSAISDKKTNDNKIDDK